MLGQRGPLCFPTVGGWAVRPIERRGEARQRILARQWGPTPGTLIALHAVCIAVSTVPKIVAQSGTGKPGAASWISV